MARRRDTEGPDRNQTYGATLRFAHRVHDLIEASPRWTKRGIAERIGRSHTTVSGWAKGRSLPSKDKDIVRLAELLDVSAGELRLLAEFDETVYGLENLEIPDDDKRAMIRSLERELDEKLEPERGEAETATKDRQHA